MSIRDKLVEKRRNNVIRNRKWRAENPVAWRNSRMKMFYGITAQEWDDMLLAQGGRCALCGAEEDRWHTDHDHSTGKVRGILCCKCNTGLGKFNDDPELLGREAEYLRRTA